MKKIQYRALALFALFCLSPGFCMAPLHAQEEGAEKTAKEKRGAKAGGKKKGEGPAPVFHSAILDHPTSRITPAKVDEAAKKKADYILSLLPSKQGFAVLPNCSNTATAIAIATQSNLVVSAETEKEETALALRNEIKDSGLLNTAVYFSSNPLSKIGVANHYADLLFWEDLSDDLLASLPATEILRATSPLGVAVIGRSKDSKAPGTLSRSALESWASSAKALKAEVVENEIGLFAVLKKAMPNGTDDWSHWFHGPDNNPATKDTALKWPYVSQWFGLPMHGAQPNTSVVSAGRIYTATGACGNVMDAEMVQATASTLYCRSIYNGAVIWKRSLSPHYRVHISGMVALPDKLLLVDNDGVLVLDARTGKELARIAVDGAEKFVKYIAAVGETLYMIAGEPDPAASSGLKYDAEEISKAPNTTKIPWGCGKRLIAWDLKNNKKIWEHQESANLDTRSIGIMDGKIYFYADNSRVACLDAKTGSQIWENKDPELIKKIEDMPESFGHAIKRTNRGLMCTPPAIIIGYKEGKQIVALSPQDGKVLWTKAGGKHNDMFFVKDFLWTEGEKIDPATGKEIGKMMVSAIRACSRKVGGPDSIFGGGGRGYDLTTDKTVQSFGWKSGCHEGSIPANGMLFATAHMCACPIIMRGFIGLSSAGSDYPFDAKATDAERLESFPNAAKVAPLEITPQDWSTYRANPHRSSSTPSSASAKGDTLWEYKPKHPFFPTPPVSAGGLVFVGGDDGILRCFEEKSGQIKWEYAADGAINASPTLWEGRVYIGTANGFVICLEASTGRPLWRNRLAPTFRNIMLYGKVSSTWPVNSGILIENGIAYATAGIVDADGSFIYAFDAKTGAFKWQNNDFDVCVTKDGNKGLSPVGTLVQAKGKVWMPGGTFGSPGAFDTGNGAFTMPPINDKYYIGLRGREIGFFKNKYLITGGLPLYDMPNSIRRLKGCDISFIELDASGKGIYPEIGPFSSALMMPAWDDQMIAAVVSGYQIIEAFDTPKFEAELQEGRKTSVSKVEGREVLLTGGAGKGKKAVGTTHASKIWSDENRSLWGMALASNALVIASGDTPKGYGESPSSWTIAALNRADGKPLWENKLDGEPLVSGPIVTKAGNVVLPMKNGTIRCYGTK